MTSPPPDRSAPPVALFDWDGTLHQRATIRAFTGFLVGRGLLPASVDAAMDAAYLDYESGISDHDVLVERVVGAYAVALTGLEVATVEAHAEEFVAVDVASLRPFTAELLGRVAAMGIESVIISGSPEVVLRHHAQRLPIGRLYGVLLGEHDGRYVGTVAHNTGLAREKAAAVRDIVATHSVVLGVGDSRSDLPLLRAARLPVLIGGVPMDEEPRALLVAPDGSGLDAVLSALAGIVATG